MGKTVADMVGKVTDMDSKIKENILSVQRQVDGFEDEMVDLDGKMLDLEGRVGELEHDLTTKLQDDLFTQLDADGVCNLQRGFASSSCPSCHLDILTAPHVGVCGTFTSRRAPVAFGRRIRASLCVTSNASCCSDYLSSP